MSIDMDTTTTGIIRSMATTALSAMLAVAPVGASQAKTAASAPAAGSCQMADDDAIAALFEKWNLALASLDSSRVAAMYWPDAVLLPTVSNTPRTDTASITDYFDHFLLKFPRGKIVRRVTHHSCGISVDAGLYDFSLFDQAGKASVVSARYTFVYAYRDGEWKIQHHHSSAMPEPVEERAKSTDAPPHADGAHVADGHDEPPRAGTSSGPGPRQATPAATPAATPPKGRPRIQLESATRMPWSFLSADQRRKVGRETVGIKVCAASNVGERTFTVSDAAAHAEANEAAVAWAKAARWTVSGAAPDGAPICAQVVVRFTDAVM